MAEKMVKEIEKIITAAGKVAGIAPFVAWVLTGLFVSATCVWSILTKGFFGGWGTVLQLINLLGVAILAALTVIYRRYPVKEELVGGICCLAFLLCFLGGYGFLEFHLQEIGWNLDWRECFSSGVILVGLASGSLFFLTIAPQVAQKGNSPG